jgi:mxaJ protein
MRRVLALLALWLLATPAFALIVCADPNNLPFSNRAREGFENKLVTLLARDLHTEVQYLWWAQRRGFPRHTLTPAGCDLWPGVAVGTEGVRTTRPYYRSTYEFVTRRADPLAHLSLGDPRLRKLTIGVQMVGYEAINTPPAQALAERGLTQNVRGFTLFGDYREPNPPAAIVHAVADGAVDVALVWGPLAGYFARQSAVPLRLEPITDSSRWRMSFDIALGVRSDEEELRERLDGVLAAEQPTIDALLHDFHIPRVPLAGAYAAR